jgi:predicted flap endonuclease-1-like 5' DNA nuclease
MTALVTQILGCLLVAAGIGFAVGWLLRHRSAVSNDHQLTERETELRVKGQALDTALYELKVKTSSLMMLESKIASLESLGRSAHQEVVSRQERIERLQRELKDSQAQAVSSQAEYQAQQQRLAEQETAMAAFANEVREANAARTKAQEELHHKEQEILELQERLAEAAAPRAEIDRLRAHISELEPAQGRVHWLEVQLSERDAQHRRAVQLLETEIAARDRRLAESAQQAELLAERDRRIDTLERRLSELHTLQAEMAGQAKTMGEQEEEISRLRKRLGEVRAALRGRDDGSPVLARPNGPANQLSLQIPAPKQASAPRKDDLKKIPGIGPAIERALNKMGTFTYVQIAKWKDNDIARVARKLDTRSGRVKPDHWIAGAKKQHREKYGEKL